MGRLWRIYSLRDPRTSEIRYVGKSHRGLHARMSQHLHDARIGKKQYVYNWMRPLLVAGLRPIVCILQVGAGPEWGQAERRWIGIMRERGEPLTNLTDGGEGTPGFVPSPQFRDRVRKALMGNKHALGCIRSFETRATLRGINRSPETRAKMSRAQKGRFVSLEARAKMRLAHLGKPISPEQRNKRLGKKNSLGCVRSPEFREKLRQANLGKKAPIETRARMVQSQIVRWRVYKVAQEAAQVLSSII